LIAGLWGLSVGSTLEFANSLPDDPTIGEGWVVFPKISAIAAKHFPQLTDDVEIHTGCIDLLADIYTKYRGMEFDKLKTYEARKGYNKWRLSSRTAEALRILEELQPGDMIIVSVQNGSYHQDVSPLEATARFAENEFPLHTVALGSSLMVYPELIWRGCKPIFAMGDEIIFPTERDDREQKPYYPIFWFHYMDGKYEWLRSADVKLDTCHDQLDSAMIATAFIE